MTRTRIGVISPTEVAFPTVKQAFAEIWPEAQPICVLDDSLYADFINDDFSIPDPMPEDAYARIAELLRYSVRTGADAVIFCGSVFGRLVEAGREGMDVPVLTSYEGMIETAFTQGNRFGILATAQGTIGCLSDDIERYASARGLTYSIASDVVPGAFDLVVAGDREGHDRLIVEAAARMTDVDALMMGQFSMGLVPKKIAPVEGRPVLTAPHTAVAKLKGMLAA